MEELLKAWLVWIGLVATVVSLLAAYERLNKARRDRFDWVIEIAARSAKEAGEDALAGAEKAKLLLGEGWKTNVWNLMRTTWTERPKADDADRLLRFCVEARLHKVAASGLQKSA